MQAMSWVVMGVSGCGKSSVGIRLAAALGVPFVEGDLFHSAQNVARMASGVALTDDDRAGWLASLQEELRRVYGHYGGVVLSCSSLKKRYRDLLREALPGLRFVHLHGDAALIGERMRARTDHYMPASLLDSQLAALEPLQPGEAGIVLSIAAPPGQLVDAILASRAS